MTFLEFLGLTWMVLIALNLYLSQLRKEAAEEAAEEIAQFALEKIVREVYIETVEIDAQQYFLVYDAKTHAYIAQGKTQEEINHSIKSRYPDTIFAINNFQRITG